MLLLLGSVGLAVSLIALGVAALGSTASAPFDAARREIAARGDLWRTVTAAGANLTERLSDRSRPPLTAEELPGLADAGCEIEDEGGKLSVPSQMWGVFALVRTLGFGNPFEAGRRVAQLWGVPYLSTHPEMSYSMVPASHRSRILIGVEHADEIALLMGYGANELARVRRAFTPFAHRGVNVNTAPEDVLEGLVLWQRYAAKTHTDPLIQGSVSSQGDPTRSRFVEVLPLPSYDPVMVFDDAGHPLEPVHVFASTLPSGLMRLHALIAGVYQDHQSRRQFASLHPLAPPGMPPGWHPQDPDPATWYRAHWLSGIPQQTFRRPYVLEPQPWVRGLPTTVSEIIGGRPLSPETLTQPLGLFWVTPEAWWMPFLPVALQEVADASADSPIANIGLSASAFTGWISLQGPGPFQATSDVYTVQLTVRGRPARVALRLMGDASPRIIASDEEGS